MKGLYAISVLLALGCTAVVGYGATTVPPMVEVYGGGGTKDCYKVTKTFTDFFYNFYGHCENDDSLQ